MNDDEWNVKGIFGNLDKFKSIPATRGRRQSFMACCPAHDDKSPSLRIDVTDEGNILLHCFAGCDVDSICASCNINVRDLFPDKNYQGNRYTRLRPVNEPTLDHHYLAVIKAQIRRGEAVSNEDKQRYIQAAKREAMKHAKN